MSKPIRFFCLPGPAELGQRISVIGSSCSGKTTLAKTIADALNIRFIELDALHWGADWTPTPTKEFRSDVQEIVSRDNWIIDGNYSSLRDIIWPRVDTFVWLDYPLAVVLWRWFKRTSRRVITQERLWNGNAETLRGAVFSSDSLLVWLLKRFYKRRQEYKELLHRSDYKHTTRVYLSNPRQTAFFCLTLKELDY